MGMWQGASTLDEGDGHGRQTPLRPGLFMGKGCSQGRGEEFWGYAPSCLPNACLRSLPFRLVLSQSIPPLSLSQQDNVCIPPCPFSAIPELGKHLGPLSTPKAAATQLTPLGLCSTEPPLMGPPFSITSKPRSHAAPRCSSGSLEHHCTKSPPPRAQIHPGASHHEAGQAPSWILHPKSSPPVGARGGKAAEAASTSIKADTPRARGRGLLVTRPRGRQPAVGTSPPTISGLLCAMQNVTCPAAASPSRRSHPPGIRARRLFSPVLRWFG